MPKEPLPPPQTQINIHTVTVRPKWEVNPNGHIYPELRFSGKYLEDANFLIGRPVIVAVCKNKVVISVRQPDTAVNPDINTRLDNIRQRRQSSAARRKDAA